MAVPALRKPQNQWCRYCHTGTGCTIYSARPDSCRVFMCGYLTNPSLTAAWKPSRAKFVLAYEESSRRVVIHVDTGRPDAWRREPYYGQFKTWAQKAIRERGQVVVMVGRRAIMIFPDRDVDLGEVADDEVILTGEHSTPSGNRLEAYKVKRDDPIGVEIAASYGRPVAIDGKVHERLTRGPTL
jgi:hypothetical protein